MAKNIYDTIAEKISAQLDAGVRPWNKSWQNVSRLPLRSNGIPYQGVNIILLWVAAMEHGYEHPMWMTYKQALDLGGYVREGEKSPTKIVYSSRGTKEVESHDGIFEEKSYQFMRSYSVFNVEQIEGLPEEILSKGTGISINKDDRNEAAEAFFKNTKAKIKIKRGCIPCWRPSSDEIHMPPFEVFDHAHGYYTTLGHEMIHWTAPARRLDRSFGLDREAYAKEELVAEMGAAFLAAELGLALEPREDHAQYIADWSMMIKDNKRFLISAASKAQEAVNYLKELQPVTGGE